ncbi:hypothetical protein K3727_09655 [Rhodobacteraceae bacterium M382]|nr:hypothetical protein K3727_09655 [Rhodobacteraceae bacterium M382]
MNLTQRQCHSGCRRKKIFQLLKREQIRHRKYWTREAAEFSKELFRSPTLDRGTEMSGDRNFTLTTGFAVVVFDPRSPQQRGMSENTTPCRDGNSKMARICRFIDRQRWALTPDSSPSDPKKLNCETPAERFMHELRRSVKTAARPWHSEPKSGVCRLVD